VLPGVPCGGVAYDVTAGAPAACRSWACTSGSANKPTPSCLCPTSHRSLGDSDTIVLGDASPLAIDRCVGDAITTRESWAEVQLSLR
jgi:hypothetical protein